MQDERQNNMEKSYRRRVSSAAGSAAADACLQEGFLTAIDLYKQAALLAKEKDLQAEAQAMSRLGCLYKVGALLLVTGANSVCDTQVHPLPGASGTEKSNRLNACILSI
jgi:hypothetical protein